MVLLGKWLLLADTAVRNLGFLFTLDFGRFVENSGFSSKTSIFRTEIRLCSANGSGWRPPRLPFCLADLLECFGRLTSQIANHFPVVLLFAGSTQSKKAARKPKKRKKPKKPKFAGEMAWRRHPTLLQILVFSFFFVFLLLFCFVHPANKRFTGK